MERMKEKIKEMEIKERAEEAEKRKFNKDKMKKNVEMVLK